MGQYYIYIIQFIFYIFFILIPMLKMRNDLKEAKEKLLKEEKENLDLIFEVSRLNGVCLDYFRKQKEDEDKFNLLKNEIKNEIYKK